MRAVAFVLTCAACAAVGRRTQVRPPKHSLLNEKHHFSDEARESVLVESVLAQVNESQSQRRVELQPLKALMHSWPYINRANGWQTFGTQSWPNFHVGNWMGHKSPSPRVPPLRASVEDDALTVPPAVSVQGVFRAPRVSTESYLTDPSLVRLSAVVSWTLEKKTAVKSRLLEARVQSEVTGEWSDWEPAAVFDAEETSHAVPIEPGLKYQFRLAGLSEEGQQLLMYSEASETVSALGDPGRRQEFVGPQKRAEADPMALVLDTSDATDGWLVKRSERTRIQTVIRGTWAPGEQPLLALAPTSAEVALLQAQESLVSAIRSGKKRLRIDLLVPGLNPEIQSSHTMNNRLKDYTALALANALPGLRVQTIFPSAGEAAAAAAAFARVNGQPLGEHVGLGSISGAVSREAVQAGVDFTPSSVSGDAPADVYIVVAPTNNRGDAVAFAVEQAVAKVPNASWVLFNPDLEDTVLGSVYGIKATGNIREFVGSFEWAYYYRGRFTLERPSLRPLDRGCLVYQFGGQWVAYGRRGEEYFLEEVEAFDAKPSKQRLDDAFRRFRELGWRAFR